MGFKDKLTDLRDALNDAAKEAAGLDNKNLSDVLNLASVRVAQALEHPDVDRVDGSDGQKNMQLGQMPASPGPASFQPGPPTAFPEPVPQTPAPNPEPKPAE